MHVRPVSRINVSKYTFMRMIFPRLCIHLKKEEKKCAISINHIKSTFTMNV